MLIEDERGRYALDNYARLCNAQLAHWEKYTGFRYHERLEPLELRLGADSRALADRPLAIRQFGGTLGVALTIAFIATPTSLADALAHFDLVWWLLIVGGLATSVLSVPLTRKISPATY